MKNLIVKGNVLIKSSTPPQCELIAYADINGIDGIILIGDVVITNVYCDNLYCTGEIAIGGDYEQ